MLSVVGPVLWRFACMAICVSVLSLALFLCDHDALGASICHDKADYGLVMCVTAAEAA